MLMSGAAAKSVQSPTSKRQNPWNAICSEIPARPSRFSPATSSDLINNSSWKVYLPHT